MTLWPFRKSPAWDEVTYWALDLETSGLTPTDQILSVGMVPIRQGVIEYGSHFYSLVRPTRPEALSVEGMKAHHILPAELEHAPRLSEVIGQVETSAGAGPLLLHYGSVDLGFLRRGFKALGKPWTNPAVVDTVALLAKLAERQRRLEPYAKALPTGLAAARAELGLPAHLEHHALWDALATAELFLLLRHRLGANTLRDLA